MIFEVAGSAVRKTEQSNVFRTPSWLLVMGSRLKSGPKCRSSSRLLASEAATLMLAGLLIEPPDAKETKPPLVVCVHGSESTASINRNRYPYVLAAQGISAFVFDKRGAGASEGKLPSELSYTGDRRCGARHGSERPSDGPIP